MRSPSLRRQTFDPVTNDHSSIWRLPEPLKCYRSAGVLVRLWPGFVLAAGLWAQEIAPIGIVRGALMECDTTHLTVNADENHVFRFLTDPRTFIERDHLRIFCDKLSKGDRLEIVSDRSPDPGIRYARLISVVNPETRPRRRALMAIRAPVPYDDPTVSIAPRGSLTFTGVVLSLNADGLVLRTRVDGEKWILVRRDTRFRADGLQVESTSLHSSTRVFVRAGRNLDGEIEAYEVVWGEILAPSGLR